MYTFTYPTLHILNHYFSCGKRLQNGLGNFSWHGVPAKFPCAVFFTIPFSFQTLIQPSTGYNIMGLDVPVLVSPDVKPKGTIMILAQDPLRSISAFRKCSINLQTNIIVGLPFAVQCTAYRGTKVWHAEKNPDGLDGIITNLLNAGYAVYLTDVKKFYAGKQLSSTAGQVSAYKPGKAGMTTFINMLCDEIKCVQPIHIVAFGSLAQNTMKKVCANGIPHPVINLPHPSGRNKFWNTILYKSDACKSAYLTNEILKKIP